MLKLTNTMIALAMLLTGSVVMAADNPLHNPVNPYDVDNNGTVSPRDFLLIVNELQRRSDPGALPLVSSQAYFWDTNSDTRVSPGDGLLVINNLMNTPEPSTIAMGGLGLGVLAGLCWRRRKKS